MAKAIVVGDGVSGLCSAWYLLKDGWDVEIVTASSANDQTGCSFGNAGLIVPSHFIPISAPGVLKQGLKWMLKPQSPLRIKPQLKPAFVRWLLDFSRSATQAHVAQSAPLLRDLNLKSFALFKALQEELTPDFGLRESGLLLVCQSQEMLNEEAEVAVMAQSLGLEAQVMSASQLEALEPGVYADITGAVHYPGDGMLDPEVFMRALKRSLEAKGVAFNYGRNVTHLSSANNTTTVAWPGGESQADAVVICGGVWSEGLVKSLGLRMPLQAGKGYSLDLYQPGIKVRMPSVLCEAKIAVTPFRDRLRIAGTMELAGVNRSVNAGRVAAVRSGALNYMPNLNPTALAEATPWAGLRPVSPDGLPFVGRVSGFGGVVVNAGHAMMGLSLGPVCGEMVAGILGGVDEFGLLQVGRFN